MTSQRGTKRQRTSRACDFCHQRGLKCRWADSADCLTCSFYNAVCTLDRPVKKRGRKPTLLSHKSELVTGRLLRIYLDTMYQCYFPFVPEKALLSQWATDGPSQTLLMALCAVSAQVASSGAVFDTALLDFDVPDSRTYFDEAVASLPLHIAESQDLDYLRSLGLMAVYCLLQNDATGLQRYLALYHALVAQQSFHDESRWPSDISLSEVDERRRLFWCVYRLEVHSACVTGHVVRMPEAQLSVEYPRVLPSMDYEAQVWTEGWSYINDLFRLLEYAITCMRRPKSRPQALFGTPSPATLSQALDEAKLNKPRSLKANLHTDRCTYMSVQIICTETLVSLMCLLYSHAPISEAMKLVKDLLDALSDAPLILFKVAGSQIVHQLLGVGHMLHNASRFADVQYATEAKRLTAFLGDLVSNLSQDIPFAQIAGERLLKLADAGRPEPAVAPINS